MDTDEFDIPTRAEARATIERLIWLGILVTIASGILMAITWPGIAECSYYDDDCISGDPTGNIAGVWVGAAFATIGGLLLAVGLVGRGVFLGLAAAGVGARAPEEQTTTAIAPPPPYIPPSED